MPYANQPIVTDEYILANVEIFVFGGHGTHPLQVAVNMLKQLAAKTGITVCAMRWEKDDITSFTTLERHETGPDSQTIIATFRQAKTQPRGTAKTWHHDGEAD